MAIYTAYIDTSAPATPVVVTESPTWVDSVVQVATGRFTVDYTGLGLTNSPAVFIQSIDSGATGDGANTPWFSHEQNGGTQSPVGTLTAFISNFVNQNGGAALNPDTGFFIILEDME